jgi:hypothetical protein
MYIELELDDEIIRIDEEELPSITDEELKEWDITREDLHRLFAEAREKMKGYTESDRVRPCADRTLGGEWEVMIVRYSAVSDPLMEEIDMGKRN